MRKDVLKGLLTGVIVFLGLMLLKSIANGQTVVSVPRPHLYSSAFGRTLVAAVDGPAARTLLSIDSNDVVTFGGVTAVGNTAITPTWNDGGTTFTALDIAIIDTASAAASKAISVKGGVAGNIQRFSVDRLGNIEVAAGNTFEFDTRAKFSSTADGSITITDNAGSASLSSLTVGNMTISNSGWPRVSATGGSMYLQNSAFSMHASGEFRLTNVGLMGFTSGGASLALDTILARDAANTFALRNGGTSGTPVPQTLRIYNWYQDGSNFERAYLGFTANVFNIGTGHASGTGRDINLQPAGDLILSSEVLARWRINDGHFVPETHGVYNIGEPDKAPLNIYAAANVEGTSVWVGETPATRVGLLEGSGFLSVVDQGAFNAPILFKRFIASGTSLTSSEPCEIIQDWNNVATTFDGLRVAITNTASHADSRPFRILCIDGSLEIFSVGPTGTLYVYDDANADVGTIALSDATYTFRDVSNNLADITGNLISGGKINLVGDNAQVALAPVWNNAGLTFSALDIAITDTASAAASKAINIKGGVAANVQRFSVDRLGNVETAAGNTISWTARAKLSSASDGNLTLANNAGATRLAINQSGYGSGTEVALTSASQVASLYLGASDRWGRISTSGFGNGTATQGARFDLVGPDTTTPSGLYWLNSNGTTTYAVLIPDAANTLAQRNGTNAQTARVYGTWASGGVQEWLEQTYDSGSARFMLRAQAAGGGTVRQVRVEGNQVTLGNSGTTFLAVNSSSAGFWNLNISGHLVGGSTSNILFGGTTSSFPALKRSATELQVRLADDSGDAALKTGGLAVGSTLKTADYTATASDHTILVGTTLGNVTISLPAASTVPGKIYVVKKTVAANTLTIDPSGTETVNGATTHALAQLDSTVVIQSDAGNWQILSSHVPEGGTLNGGITVTAAPADSTTYYGGGLPVAGFVAGYADIYGFRVPVKCTIRAVSVQWYNTTPASNEDSTLHIRKNNTTDYQLSNAVKHNATETNGTYTGLNIPLAAGDNFTFKWVTPAWATNPANVYFNWTVYYTIDP